MIFKHYRELATEQDAEKWFGVTTDAVKAVKAQMEKAKKVVGMAGAKAA